MPLSSCRVSEQPKMLYGDRTSKDTFVVPSLVSDSYWHPKLSFLVFIRFRAFSQQPPRKQIFSSITTKLQGDSSSNPRS